MLSKGLYRYGQTFPSVGRCALGTLLHVKSREVVKLGGLRRSVKEGRAADDALEFDCAEDVK